MFFLKQRNFDMITLMSYFTDLLIVNLFTYFLPINADQPLLFHLYLTLGWLTISVKNKFYEVHRHTKVPQILGKLFTQFFFFFVALYTFIGIFKQPGMSRLALGQYFFFVSLAISIAKFAGYYLLGKYREKVKGNLRNVVVIGKNKTTDQLITVFQRNTGYGYNFRRQFSSKSSSFGIEDCLEYIKDNNIDEIYCSVSELNNEQLSRFVDFADNNLKTLKFIPDNKNIFSKKLKFEYYDYVPVLSLRDIPLHNPINAFIKRSFDIVFSILVILGLLSWLTPILALIIRMESKGPIFFRQVRYGIDNREIYCYKIRSMRPNVQSDQKWATKDDPRITRVGKFIRRTSIDELPQFYNVLFGTMSVVGPRPHPLVLTDDLSKKIDKFMVRHFVKPGITGLAQVKGERGEIEKDSDGLNRVRFDIFYIENWSLFLDLKIVVQTVVNALQGEEKAY